MKLAAGKGGQEYVESPPSRRRGLKYSIRSNNHARHKVASLAEAWIEICGRCTASCYASVASLTEAWIEIFQICVLVSSNLVASLAEAWIEISYRMRYM